MDLNIFYTALAPVAATLIGLLFIAIQQNAERLSDPHNRWRAIAVSTFYSYTVILIVALFTFIPLLRTQALWGGCLVGIWRQVGAWLPVWRLTTAGRLARLRETFWMLISPVLLYTGLIYYSTYLQGGKGTEAAESGIAGLFIALLLNLLRNSWRLLVEIPSEGQQNK